MELVLETYDLVSMVTTKFDRPISAKEGAHKMG